MYNKNHFDTIRQYKLGAVVVYNSVRIPIENGTIPADNFGHITGFSTNMKGELLIDVKWANNNEFAIHPSNIMVL